MHFIEASNPSLLSFFILLTLVTGMQLFALKKALEEKAPNLIRGYLIGLLLFGAWVLSGQMKTSPMPFIPLTFALIFGIGIKFALSPHGLKVATQIPLAYLVGFQSFRFPLELVLHDWAASGTVPPTMTWTGQNWDIVSGLVCLIAAPLIYFFKDRQQKLATAIAWIAQGISFALLINVIRVVVFSSPLPFAWPLENPIQLILYLPYAWIGPVMVIGAFVAHLITFRALLAQQKSA